MTNWKETTLGEIGRVVTGKTPPTSDVSFYGGKYPFITPTDIEDDCNYCTTDRYLSEEGKDLQKSILLPKNAVCYTCIASIGKICLTKEESFTNQQINSVIVDENKANYKFIFYLLKYLTSQIKKMAGGTITGIINKGQFESFLFEIPDSIEEQKEIAGVLGSLDDKIELLREENKTLEAMAQAIFKEWFVNFNFPNAEGKPYKSSGGKMIDSELGEIPEKWRVGKLSELGGEISDFVANGSFASLKENVTLYDTPNFALFLRNTDLKSNFAQKVFVDEHSYHFLKKTQLHGGEIIISNVGDVGSVYLCPYLDIPMVLGNNVISLRSEYQSYFFTLFTNRIGQFLINTITGGSAQPKFNKTDFRNMKMIMPTDGILNLYESVAWPLYAAGLQNNSQIQTLSTLRDTLLPKLMSGEINTGI